MCFFPYAFRSNFINFSSASDIDNGAPSFVETFDELSLSPTGTNAANAINGKSSLIKIWILADGKVKKSPKADDKFKDEFLKNGRDSDDVADAAGNLPDWEPTVEDYKGYKFEIKDPSGDVDAIVNTGLKGLKQITDISIVCAPDENAVDDLQDAIVNHCELLKDRFAITQTERGAASDLGDVKPEKGSKYSALYFPWINVFDPLTDTQKLIPPGGHVDRRCPGGADAWPLETPSDWQIVR